MPVSSRSWWDEAYISICWIFSSTFEAKYYGGCILRHQVLQVLVSLSYLSSSSFFSLKLQKLVYVLSFPGLAFRSDKKNMSNLKEDIKKIQKSDKLEESLYFDFKDAAPVKGNSIFLCRSYAHSCSAGPRLLVNINAYSE